MGWHLSLEAGSPFLLGIHFVGRGRLLEIIEQCFSFALYIVMILVVDILLGGLLAFEQYTRFMNKA